MRYRVPVTTQSEFDLQLERTVNRLQTISLEKLSQGTRITDSRLIIQRLADLALDATGVSRRLVPELSPASLGDQLAVIGRQCAGLVDDMTREQLARELRDFRLTL